MIKKIMCFCGSGLGTSFVMEMNAKKALKNLGIEGVTVEHSTIDDVVPGAADLFVCSADLLPNAKKAGKAIGLNNMVAVKEIQEKLKEAKKYDSKIVIKKDTKAVEATKLMAVMSLGVKCGQEVEVEISGSDETTAYEELKAFFEANL